MRTEWARALTDTLLKLKKRGYTFEAAWAEAIRLHPVKGPQLREIEAENLFESSEVGESPASFMRRACDDAWHDRKPMLKNLRILVDSEGDASLTSFRFRGSGSGRW